jgi:hypothetical protein
MDASVSRRPPWRRRLWRPWWPWPLWRHREPALVSGAAGSGPAPPSQRHSAAAAALVVHVQGHRLSAEALTRALPSGWVAVQPQAEPAGRDGLTVPDLVVLANPSAGAVRTARSEQPTVRLLAVVREDADVGSVVAILDAGADACVRGEHPAMVAAHLLALHRRGEPGRGAA